MMVLGLISLKVPALASLLDSVGSSISRTALHKRFTEAAVNFMRRVFLHVIKFKSFSRLSSSVFDCFESVLICDSTWCELSDSLKDILPGSGGVGSQASCKLQLVFNFLTGEFVNHEISKGTKNDMQFVEDLIATVQRKALLIVDLGYFSLQLFYELNKKGAYFLSRLRSGIRVFEVFYRTEMDLFKLLSKLNSKEAEFEVLIGCKAKSHEVQCRLIALRVPEEVIKQRKDRYIKSCKGKGQKPNERNLQLMEWTLLITNTPKKILPASLVYILYTIRWQVELIFKQFKSVYQLDTTTHTKNPHRIFCEIYGRLIAAALTCNIWGQVNSSLWNEDRKELSFDKLFKRIQQRAFSLLELIRKDLDLAKNYMLETLSCCLKNCIKLKQRSRISSLERFVYGPRYTVKVYTPGQILELWTSLS